MQTRRAGTWQYLDNLSWVHGNHNVKMGGEFRYVFENGYDAFGARPQFEFNAFGNYGVQIVNCAGACANDEVIQTLGAALLGFGYEQQTQYFDVAGTRTATNFRKYRQHCDNHHNDKQEDGRANAPACAKTGFGRLLITNRRQGLHPHLRSKAPVEDESKTMA